MRRGALEGDEGRGPFVGLSAALPAAAYPLVVWLACIQAVSGRRDGRATVKTKIEWTDVVWNPVTGCTPVSTGCDHCYAARLARRLAGRAGYDRKNPFAVTCRPARLAAPFRWPKPKKVFVCSMGDLFHEDVPDSFIEAVLAVISLAGEHTFLLLTKRPVRMATWFRIRRADRRRRLQDRHNRAINGAGGNRWPLPNLWLGVSIENQETADERIPLLLQCPAAIRFVSAEPLLGPVDLRGTRSCRSCGHWPTAHGVECAQCAEAPAPDGDSSAGLDWIIVGGESGPGARPMRPAWARGLRDQAVAAGVPFFFKQWGAWFPDEQFEAERKRHPGSTMLPWNVPDTAIVAFGGDPYYRVGKKAAGRFLDGRTWDQFPQPEGAQS